MDDGISTQSQVIVSIGTLNYYYMYPGFFLPNCVWISYFFGLVEWDCLWPWTSGHFWWPFLKKVLCLIFFGFVQKNVIVKIFQSLSILYLLSITPRMTSRYKCTLCSFWHENSLWVLNSKRTFCNTRRIVLKSEESCNGWLSCREKWSLLPQPLWECLEDLVIIPIIYWN